MILFAPEISDQLPEMRLPDTKIVPSWEVELGVGLETKREEERKKAWSLTEALSTPPRKALPCSGMSIEKGWWS